MDHLAGKPRSERDDAIEIIHALRIAGFIAYFAGGCVRDALLGLQPKDFDVATDAPPAKVRELFRNTQAVGAAFGVILVRMGQSTIEVATFRSDGEYLDGRRPDKVVFTTADFDAQRRDFTINGLFYDPIEDRVIDHVGGVADLQNRQIRAIGNPDARFAEDHLRLLRAVRFAARFNFEIEPETASSIERHAKHLPRISPERIADELRRILIPPTRKMGYQLLWKFKLIDQILRDLKVNAVMRIDPTRSLVEQLSETDNVSFGFVLMLAMIDYRWHGGGFKYDALGYLSTVEVQLAIKTARHALRISNEETTELSEPFESLHHLLTAKELTVALMKRQLAKPTFDLAFQLIRVLSQAQVARNKLSNLKEKLDALKHTSIAPPPLLTGDDLTTAGIRPSPLFKKILDTVYDAQLEDKITTKEQALKMGLTIK